MDEIPTSPQSIVEQAKNRENVFNSIIESASYDNAGMWFSELFLFIILFENTDCNRIIESGRSRGISTKILSEYFSDRDVDIISIELRSNTENDKIARNRLSNSNNVQLKYGDSRQILPKIAGADSCILMDGPKGHASLELAADLLEESDVPFVCVHDLHKKSFYRDISQLLFKNKIFSDHQTIVNYFKRFDQPIREWEVENGRDSWDGEWYGPTDMCDNQSISYGPTVGVFFNGDLALNTRVVENYRTYLATQPGFFSILSKPIESMRYSGNPVIRYASNAALKLGRFLKS